MDQPMQRRTFALSSCAALLLTAASPARADGLANARALVDQVVAEVNGAISAGLPEQEVLSRFEHVFRRFADVPAIARYTLGSDARSATPAQMKAYTEAFGPYISRKYGRRFREFTGGTVTVRDARPIPNGLEVQTVATTPQWAPFRIDFHLSNRSGEVLFFNIIIEGVNLLLTERGEIQAMIDQRGGSLDRLIADLPRK